MTADEVIAIRKEWDKYSYRSFLPEATVLASRDWLSYVRAMSDMLPRDLTEVLYPTLEEARWAWPEGVCIVFELPFEIEHTIVSRDYYDSAGKRRVEETPHHFERQILQGMVLGIGQEFPARIAGTERMVDDLTFAIPALFIGTEPWDIVNGTWIPGGASMVSPETGKVSEATCFLLSTIFALGHRLTSEREVPTTGRGERRRVVRELPSLRMLALGSGASVREGEVGSHTVAWQRRWFVRGHWRNQACGPRLQQHKLRWIDPYVKGPEDKPLDERRTVWRTS